MAEEPEVVDGTVEEPSPELKEAVDEKLPAVVVHDPDDQHELMVRMDERDVQLLLTEIQSAALRRWIYELPGNKGTGLTVHAVQDITQRMNWTGKAKIGLLLDERGVPVLDVEIVEADEGKGPEPFYVATTYAKDEVTGMVLPGASMEPQLMRLKNGTTKFDRFARWKAIQKATRNALGAFIPEEIEQTVIAMFVKDSSRVERIRTEAEAKVAEMPPPLDDEQAKALIAEAERVYEEIKLLGGGQGKVKLTPGTFNAWMVQSQHSHERLAGFVAYLIERREQIPVELAREAQEREAVESANTVACPKCEAPAKQFCKGVRGAHGERIRARLEQIQGASA
jgi:hypothetical protein